jgi:hypothetical protein
MAGSSLSVRTIVHIAGVAVDESIRNAIFAGRRGAVCCGWRRNDGILGEKYKLLK